MSAAPVRVAINQANALHSTGPRTPEGKQRSAMNALKHGLTALDPVHPSEDRAAFEQHMRDFEEEYQPANPTEKQLTCDLADSSWRMNRIPALEATLIAAAAQDASHLDTALRALSTHHSRLSRHFHLTLDKLRFLQADRRRKEEDLLNRAAGIHYEHKKQGLPYNPADDGFVFSIAELDRYLEIKMRHSLGVWAESSLKYQPVAFVERERREKQQQENAARYRSAGK